jgi:hypothetical protein
MSPCVGRSTSRCVPLAATSAHLDTAPLGTRCTRRSVVSQPLLSALWTETISGEFSAGNWRRLLLDCGVLMTCSADREGCLPSVLDVTCSEVVSNGQPALVLFTPPTSTQRRGVFSGDSDLSPTAIVYQLILSQSDLGKADAIYLHTTSETSCIGTGGTESPQMSSYSV